MAMSSASRTIVLNALYAGQPALAEPRANRPWTQPTEKFSRAFNRVKFSHVQPPLFVLAFLVMS